MAKRQKTARKATNKSKAPAARRSKTAKAGASQETARLKRELSEALERQKATGEILAAISGSSSDLQGVLDTLVQSAARLAGTSNCFIFRRDGNKYRLAASHGFSMEYRAWMQLQAIEPGRTTLVGRTALEARTLHIPDIMADPEFTWHESVRRGGFRAMLGIPLLREGQPMGVIAACRPKIGPFTAKQIDLVSAFADQAVIAIENARLFDEVNARTEDLRESLQQQTATADVLKVISRSTFDLQIVLDTLVESATRLCEADHAWLFQRDGDLLRFKSSFGNDTDTHSRLRELFLRRPAHIDAGSVTGRSALEARIVHVPDVLADANYTRSDVQHIGGYRAALGVPLLRDGNVVGVIFIAKTKSEPFSEKQIELVATFADQAVIAIENVRLFEDLQARTNDLAESLEQQTATSEVLGAISSSLEDLAPLFQTVLENAVRVCGAKFGTLNLYDGRMFDPVAGYNVPREYAEQQLNKPFVPHPKSGLGTVAATRRPVHVEDVRAQASYLESNPAVVAIADVAGARTIAIVPMLKDDRLVGTLAIYRQEVNRFSDKQIALLNNFAQQAVIAIENNRLLAELRERQAELRVTFDNMGDGVVMFDAETRLAAWNRNFQEMLDLPDAFLQGRPTYADYFHYLAERGEYSADLEEQLSRTVENTREELRLERTRPDGRVIEVRRNSVPDGGFVMIYADITERKRAEAEVRLARDAAEKALHELEAAQDRLIQTEKLASLGQLTAGIAHEIKNPLNFINNFSALSVELIDELGDVLAPAPLDESTRQDTEELARMLKDNLGKVVQHGKRADSIVKNMLLHSREGSSDRRTVDINALVAESLNLAYHGARAEKRDFQIRLDQELDPAAGQAEVVPQEITRVLLNLISNAFYAAMRRKAESSSNGYEPALSAGTRNLGDRVEIRIRDNGIGIPPDVKEKMFNPFFTTKPPGEGTGLGLSLSHDIVVKQHAGLIEVDTQPGEFTEFRVVLPRAAASER